jgi:hypothetical protein
MPSKTLRPLWAFVAVCGIIALVGAVVLFVLGEWSSGFLALVGAAAALLGSRWGASLTQRYAPR